MKRASELAKAQTGQFGLGTIFLSFSLTGGQRNESGRQGAEGECLLPACMSHHEQRRGGRQVAGMARQPTPWRFNALPANTRSTCSWGGGQVLFFFVFATPLVKFSLSCLWILILFYCIFIPFE